MLTILLAAALTGMWDDETFLGRGPAIGVGLAAPITRHLSIEGEIDWGSHHRDSGYLAITGKPLSATGRVSFALRERSAAVRPFVSLGASWIRSTEHFTFSPLVAGPSGQPVAGPIERADYKASLGGWEVGVGTEIKATDRLTVRPEARWTMTKSDPAFRPGALEPPLAVIRGGVTFAWRTR